MASSRHISRSGRGKVSQVVSFGMAEVSWHGSVATLFLDGVESSSVDVDCPQRLEFEYMQHMDVACQVFLGESSPVRALHIGGAAAVLPWAWSKTRPGSRQTVIEIDSLLIEAVRSWFDLPRSPELKMRCADGREVLETTRPASWDVIVRDAFASGSVPSHLATRECALSAARALRPGGLYAVNSSHGGGSDARQELQALEGAFDGVAAVLDPKVGKGGRRGNVVFICAKACEGDEEWRWEEQLSQMDRLLRRLPLPARLMSGKDLSRWRAGASSFSDAQVGWPVSD